MSKIQLNKNFIKSSCKLALNEDLYPSGDITSELIKKNIKKKVKMMCNQNGILGGIEFAKETFKLVDNKINFKNKKKDGSRIRKGEVVATIDGNLKKAVKMSGKFYETEASGGINLKNVKNVSSSGVDRISVGSLTHSINALDLKLET